MISMQEFSFMELNRKKLRFAFAVTSLTFLILVLVVLVIAWLNGAAPSVGLVILILVVAGIALPFFILVLGWLGWLYKRRKRNSTFSRPPFNELGRIGFQKVLVNDDSKWVFTEQAWEGKVDGFTVRCDMVKDRYHILEIEVLCQRRQMEKSEFAALSKRFKQYSIEFGFGSLLRQYNTQRMTIHTIQELKSDLEHFTRLLRQEGFEPAD